MMKKSSTNTSRNMLHLPPRIGPAFAVAATAALLAASLACTPRASLRPTAAANAEDTALERAAVSEVDGVRVVAQAEPWIGDRDITRWITPVRVVVHNNGDEPIRVSYDEFALVTEDGRRYGVLPPYGVVGTVSEPALAESYPPINSPLFYSHGFQVAPYYRAVYPGVPSYTRPFDIDPDYHDHYHRIWVGTRLPTFEMQRRALPEGVVDVGGRVDGWMYFERVDPETTRLVRFQGDLVGAEGGREIGEVSIPFRVEPDSRLASR